MSTNPDRVRSIFNEVIDLPPTERAAALGRLTDNNPALRAEVEALLASHDAAHQAGFMSSPTAATTIRNAVITETPGTRIGPYKLLQVIGEGGFGTVFLAEQSEPVRRRVALKIIKLGMDTKQVIARFEAERQALALMDHPHIARVLDAGATPITEHGGGRPYFVMEYVVGDAITQFAANNNLDIRARLELFAQVCSAVQHAHTKGIIHRDIKPGNVLVTMTDGKPFARVIDFGIAKATASAGGLTDKTLFTEHRQLIGTPEYMSPEQAQGSPDIDTRTDVYALGVLLYELLAGDTPFDGKRLRSAAWDEMRRIIKEEDPPTPSARVTQRMKSGGSASSPSAPAPLRPSAPSAPSDLRGELDWIVMKSLDKDRARRYETPSALAADVERHLKGEAVQAAPPSAAYRLKKFVRRNKGPVIAGSAVAAALLVGIAGTTWQWREASIANGKLRSQHERVQRGVGKMMGLLSDGVLGAPTMSPDASGRVMDASDPLEYAIGWGIMLAEQLKDDRDSLVKQTDAAEWSAYTANLALAQQAMDAGNWPEARERLAQCPESKRGWEWRWLSGKASSVDAEVRATFSVVSPDAQIVAVMDGRTLQMLLADGTPASPRVEIDGHINWATFSENGERLLVACYAGAESQSLKVYDRDGNRVGGAAATDIPSTNAAMSPDGSRIATVTKLANGRSVLALYNADGSLLAQVAEGDVAHIADIWSPDSSRLVAKVDDTLCVWTRDAELIGSLPIPGDTVHSPVLRSGGGELVYFHDKTTAAIWTVGEAAPHIFLKHPRRVGNIGYSPDGRTVFTTCGDGFLRLWRDGTEIARIGGNNYEPPAYSPDGAHFLVESRRSLSIYNANGIPVAPPLPHPYGVQSACFAPDGQSVYSSDYASILHWSLDGRALGRTAIGAGIGYPKSLPDGRVIAAVLSGEGTDTYSQRLLPSHLAAHDRWIAPINKTFARLESDAILHDGRLADPPSSVPSTSEELAREIAPGSTTWVVTPDGSRLFSATPDRVVRIWDIASEREVASLRLDGDVASLALTEDGTRLVVMLMNGAARFLDTRPASEQTATLARRHAEIQPATAYLDSLLAGPTPTDALMDAVVNDASLTPLRRLVAVEMLEDRLAEIDWVATSTFDRIMRDAEQATDAWQMIDTKAIKAHITSAAAALEPSNDLSPRAIQSVMAQAENWEYPPSEPTDKQRLAEAERVVELTREQLQTKVTELEEAGQQLQKQTDAAEWSAYAANLALAQAALQSGNRLEAALRLEQCPESRRGWEWNVLRASADTSAYSYQAHGPLAFLDGGDRFLTRSLDNGLEFRETSSGRLIKTIVGSFGVNDVQVSPDGEYLLLAGVDRTRNEYAAAIYDVDGGAVFQTAEHDESPLTSFVANGAAFITVERFFRENSRLRVWDTKTGDMLASLEQAWPGYQWGAASPHSPHVVMCTNELVELRDVIRNTRTAILKGLNPADLIAVEFSPDGKTILTVSRATGVALWSGESGDHVATIALKSINPEEVDCVSFASNGSRVVISAYGDVAEVIDVESRAHLSTVLCQPHDVSFISRLTADGSGLLTTGGPTPRLWDATTGRFITEFAGHVRDARSISCTPDGSIVIAAAYDGVSRAWPISTTPSPLVLRVPQDAGDSARRGEFDPTVLTAPTCLAAVPFGENEDGVEWRGPNGEAAVGTERDGCTAVAFSKDGSRLIYVAHASIFERNLNDPSDSHEHCHLDLYGNYVYMGPKLIGPDDTGALWSWRQSVQRWSPGEDKESWRITLPSIAAYDRNAQTEESIRHLAFADVSADGSRLLTVFDHGTRWSKATPGRATSMPGATIWVSDARTGERLFEREVMCEAYYASAAGINRDGTLLAYTEQSGDRDISRMLNIATGETLPLITEDRWKVRRHTFSPDGSRLVAVGDYGASLWNTQTGAKLASFTQRHFEAHNSHVSFNSDASRAVVVMGGTVILIDTASGEEIAELLGHTNTITSAAFSPDDSRIATASHDQSLRIWDGATGRPLTVYTEQAPTGGADGEGFPPAGFNCLAFSPDGRRLAVGAVDGRVLVFDSGATRPQ